MFTGIIQTIGTIRSIARTSSCLKVVIRVPEGFEDVKIGESIAIEGVCLTVTKISGNDLSFDIMTATLDTTTLKNLRANTQVNLERALKAGDRLSGHMVSGHIDCVGKIRNITKRGDTATFEIAIDRKLMEGIVSKGSVAIDGISLTVSDVKTDTFLVNLIPHTLKSTTLHIKKITSPVNIELDMAGKYALKK